MAAALESHPAFEGYSERPQPLTSYATLTATFGVGLGAALATAARRGRLNDLGVGDVIGMGLATHKIARLATKDSVTSFVRAPFVHLEEKTGSNSVKEKPRGRGLQRSLGELLSCPECTGQWVAGGLLAGMLHAPRTTRAITSMYSALTCADLLQYVYTGLKRRA